MEGGKGRYQAGAGVEDGFGEGVEGSDGFHFGDGFAVVVWGIRCWGFRGLTRRRV